MSLSEMAASRALDFKRHLADLRAGCYEGAAERDEKELTFRSAVDLLTPVAEWVLQTFNDKMLAGTGTVADSGIRRAANAMLERMWTLSWPGQVTAVRRAGPPGPVLPITIRAHFPPGWTHGHLAGAAIGHWPLQVLTAEDAARQAPILWAIAEAEFHERIYETVTPWEGVPAPIGTGRP